MSTLHELRELRSSVEAAAEKRDDTIQALVSAVAKLANQSLPIRTLLDAAGISKQTYYLRLERGRSDHPDIHDLESIAPLRAARNGADRELLQALDARTAGISSVAHQFSAREIAEAAGVSEVWVRKIRRRTTASSSPGGS